MRFAAILVFLAALSTDVLAAAPEAVPLPKDVRELLERHESCVHFAGEFNGDGSARDRDVNATMIELRCEKVEKDAAALRRKYARHPDVLKALDAVDAL